MKRKQQSRQSWLCIQRLSKILDDAWHVMESLLYKCYSAITPSAEKSANNSARVAMVNVQTAFSVFMPAWPLATNGAKSILLLYHCFILAKSYAIAVFELRNKVYKSATRGVSIVPALNKKFIPMLYVLPAVIASLAQATTQFGLVVAARYLESSILIHGIII